MKVILSTKDVQGVEQLRTELSTSQQHFQIGHIEASVLFNEDGILFKIVEPYSIGNSHPCQIEAEDCWAGSVLVYNTYKDNINAQDICKFFGCQQHQQPDMGRKICFCYAVEIKRPNLL